MFARPCRTESRPPPPPPPPPRAPTSRERRNGSADSLTLASRDSRKGEESPREASPRPRGGRDSPPPTREVERSRRGDVDISGPGTSTTGTGTVSCEDATGGRTARRGGVGVGVGARVGAVKSAMRPAEVGRGRLTASKPVLSETMGSALEGGI